MQGVFLEELTWPEARDWFERGAPIIVPVGAIAKEHGHHLPLDTDYRTARALAEGVAKVLPVVIAPVVCFGYYPAFRHYPGSQHLSAPTFIALVTELLEGYIEQGVRELAVINTGVSTVAPLDVVIREIRERHDVRVAVADIERLGRGARGVLEQTLGGHGDESETSVMLNIAPQTVRMERARPDYGNLRETPRTVFRQPSVFRDDPGGGIDHSATGVRGDPTLATAEKGVLVLDAMVDDLIEGLQALFPGTLSPRRAPP